MEKQQNHELRLAWDFVMNTGTSIFLTGKAGTGKTTFLKTLKEKAPKRMVVVAPTGVAAINAGGVTIHSFFQLPLSPYVPEASFQSKFDFSKEKRSIIKTMDLLVIDEISMVRSDLLDAVDNVLRRYRNHKLPFGGVQLLMIGDLQQLAPVVTEQDAQLIGKYYDTPFFFGSHALQHINYVTIELKQVYRQSDERFLNLLNNIREGRATQQDYNMLNQRCKPNFTPADAEGYIRLTTHNNMAQHYNEKRLHQLTTEPHTFQATIEGTFPEYAYPTETELTLKLGAQVMFVKNDPSPEHLYYNGKIGHVKQLDRNAVVVHCPDDDYDIEVQPMTWENTKYVLNEKTKEIEAEVQGTFSQYPLRLAWAITIHKSQGLTFERAIIDASLSFASGQVYVALSRCKSLEGLVLASSISQRAVINDARIDAYIARQEQEAQRSIQLLPQLREQYFAEQLRELFDFSDLLEKEEWMSRVLDEHFFQQFPTLCRQHRFALQSLANEVVNVATKWVGVINATAASQLHAQPFLERVERSARFFHQAVTDILQPLLEETSTSSDNKAVKKKFDEALADVTLSYEMKQRVLRMIMTEGFSIANYLRFKAKAVLEAIEENGSKKQVRKRKNTVSMDDIKHPELYKRLILWRENKASRQDTSPNNIIQQRALINIVNYLPADRPSLIAVQYVGRTSADRYGEDILEIVNTYLVQNNLTGTSVSEIKKEAKQKKGVPETYQITFDMYRQGKSPAMIAKERGNALSTIMGHLSYFVQRGQLPLSDFVSPAQQHAILQSVGKVGVNHGLTAIKNNCSEDVTYDQIKMVLGGKKNQ